jgi:two-component system sensor histidine kinase RegB
MTTATPDLVPRLDRPPAPARQAGGASNERLRLRTLVDLRWGAVGAQLIALLIARFPLGANFPLAACLGMVGLSSLFNLILVLALPPQRVLRQWEAVSQLGFDILQLGGVLLFTGGAANPFTVLLIVPVIQGASSLEGRHTRILAGLAVLVVLVLALAGGAAPTMGGAPVVLPSLYRWGMAIAVILGLLVSSTYARGAAADSSRMELALHAAQAVLARGQRMSALGGLAAAAAHELGTPLATIAVVAKEMARECPPGSLREDAELVSSQAQRCREILRRLADAPETGDAVHARVALPQLLEEVAGPEEDPDDPVRVEWSIVGPPDSDPPEMVRHPEIVPALTSFIENALDFAKSEVRLVGRYDYETISIEVRDDGPGFAPEIFAKLGEPYVTSRPAGENSPSGHLGMGLGFFIAKTLLERTGAVLEFRNERGSGAVIVSRWPRDSIEAPPD